MYTVGVCGHLERTDFYHLLLSKSDMDRHMNFNPFYYGRGGGLERINFNSFYFVRMWWSSKNCFLTVSTVGGYGGLERPDFYHLLLFKSGME